MKRARFLSPANALAQILACAGMFFAIFSLSGCAEVPNSPESPTKPSVKGLAPSTDVGRMQAWKDAEQVAAAGEGRTTVIGSGQSMAPIYGENTMLVLTPIDYDKLKTGMQAAYVNEAGHRVVHVLLTKDSKGWRVQGLGNDEEDEERVTRFNLIGIVYASFATDADVK